MSIHQKFIQTKLKSFTKRQQPFKRTHFIPRNDGFTCTSCNHYITPAKGTFRNHCPYCLWSKHVDDKLPGDRISSCLAPMKPIELLWHQNRFSILHICISCKKTIRNKCAPDDIFSSLLNTKTNI